MLQTKLLQSTTLERQPSCIAFSPVQPDIFIVGTYELYGSESDEKTTRDGSLIVFRLQRGILYVMKEFLRSISHPVDTDCIDNMFKPFPCLSPFSTYAFPPTAHISLHSLQALASSECVPSPPNLASPRTLRVANPPLQYLARPLWSPPSPRCRLLPWILRRLTGRHRS